MNESLRKVLGYPIDTPLKFWLKYWHKYIKELCDLDIYDIRIDNPHFLLKEIISEIEYNDFRNSENRSLFKDLLGKARRQDSVFAELYKVEIGIVLKNWDASPLVVRTICDEILQSMDEGSYLERLAQKIQHVIEEQEVLNDEVKDQISFWTDLLVQELVCLGVDVKDIDKFIEEDEFAITEDGEVLFCRDSFYELKRENYKSERDYYHDVSERYKSRCIKEYVDNILRHFHKEAEDGYVILRLLGVRGSISHHFKDIHLYSIDKETYLPENSISKIERTNTSQFVNAAVKVKHKYFNTSIQSAVRRLDSLLDYLSFNVRCEDGLSISKQFAAIVVDGELCGSYDSVKDDIGYIHQYRDLTAFDLTPYNENINNWLKEFAEGRDIDNDTFRKIGTSTHWYRKALSANKHEDKLLYSWIALESLFKVSDDIKNNISPKKNSSYNVAQIICACIMTRNKFYSYASNVYQYLIRVTQMNDNYYDFTVETIDRARLNLKQGECLELSFFFKELPAMISEMNDEIFKRDLQKVQKFYDNEKSIKEFWNSVCGDITIIYRLRNMIVHNAICPEFQIKLYAYKAQFITATLIQALRYHYNKYGMGIDDALLQIYSRYQILEADIINQINNLKAK